MHQQDVQAVVNALWAGGRRGDDDPGPAGHRHQRRPVRRQHPDPPGPGLLPALRITAIGDIDRDAAAASTRDPSGHHLQQWVDAVGLGYDVHTLGSTEFPAYSGSVDFQYATPIRPTPAPRDLCRQARMSSRILVGTVGELLLTAGLLSASSSSGSSCWPAHVQDRRRPTRSDGLERSFAAPAPPPAGPAPAAAARRDAEPKPGGERLRDPAHPASRRRLGQAGAARASAPTSSPTGSGHYPGTAAAGAGRQRRASPATARATATRSSTSTPSARGTRSSSRRRRLRRLPRRPVRDRRADRCRGPRARCPSSPGSTPDRGVAHADRRASPSTARRTAYIVFAKLDHSVPRAQGLPADALAPPRRP